MFNFSGNGFDNKFADIIAVEADNLIKIITGVKNNAHITFNFCISGGTRHAADCRDTAFQIQHPGTGNGSFSGEVDIIGEIPICIQRNFLIDIDIFVECNAAAVSTRDRNSLIKSCYVRTDIFGSDIDTGKIDIARDIGAAH